VPLKDFFDRRFDPEFFFESHGFYVDTRMSHVINITPFYLISQGWLSDGVVVWLSAGYEEKALQLYNELAGK
jgi:hypothetical protein